MHYFYSHYPEVFPKISSILIRIVVLNLFSKTKKSIVDYFDLIFLTKILDKYFKIRQK